MQAAVEWKRCQEFAEQGVAATEEVERVGLEEGEDGAHADDHRHRRSRRDSRGCPAKTAPRPYEDHGGGDVGQCYAAEDPKRRATR